MKDTEKKSLKSCESILPAEPVFQSLKGQRTSALYTAHIIYVDSKCGSDSFS